jgi:NAD(P)H-flavin reductase
VVKCSNGVDVPFLRRRMAVRDVERAVGKEAEAALVYVCGVPGMTDQFVEALTTPGGLGMDKRRVLFEKWW